MNPTQAGLEITTKCHAECIGCPHGAIDRKNRNMGTDIALELIDQLSDMGVKKLSPYRVGEPTLHPDWAIICSHGLNKGMKVRLYTNVSTLNDETVADELAVSVSEVVFSIDGLTIKSSRRARPGLDPDQIFSNAAQFLSRKKRPPVTVRMTAFDWSENEADAFCKKWKALGAEAVIVVPDIRSGKLRNSLIPCMRLESQITILVDCKVALCCRDWYGKIILGDAATTSLHDIWTGKPYNKIRALHVQGTSDSIPLCAGCTSRWKENHQ